MHPDTTYYPTGSNSVKKVSSRLAKKKQATLLQQTWFIFMLSGLLLLGFIFVVVPNLLNTIFSDSPGSSFLDEDTIAPQVPIFSAPPQATFSASIEVSGFTEPKSTVFIIVNDESQAEVVVQDDGTFKQAISLKTGENTVRSYAKDAAGNESDLSRLYTIFYDNEAPLLELDGLQDGQTIELKRNQLVTVKGKTEAQARITLNGRLIVADSAGMFSTTYQLQEGENILSFSILDEAGNVTNTEIKLQFKL